MRIRFLPVVAIALVLAGCGGGGEKPGQPTNAAASSEGGVLSAPADYVGAVAKAQQTAVKTIDTASLNKAIQMFNVQEGRNPKDLNELVEKKYYPQVPAPPFGMKIEYDSTSGEVRVVKQ
jgi:hypothetical protein